ncbi:hypothetical protein [Winogradskyella tangerina]|uniref:hypothetical protein n=1 Tax=Winogradskyella tangerina TaxID=2023240 RepID=UPI0013002764|nr:hypothetical protein [Winogradskyella tangerina]
MKRVIGVVLFAISGLIFLFGLFSAPDLIASLSTADVKSNSYNWGEFSGRFTAFLTMIGLGCLFLICGLTLYKQKSK